MIKPFLKWAGGKRKLAPFIVDLMPPKINTYYEPFIGAGALYCELHNLNKFQNSIISDINEDLINAYQVLKFNPNALLSHLSNLDYEYIKKPKETFLKERDIDVATLDTAKRAARFIFLNRTCFNGLYRVNKKGKFNVPWGKYLNPSIVQKDLLLDFSNKLQNTVILNVDFEAAVASAKPGDLVYFDPPYIPIDEQSFTKYTKDGFTIDDHERLANCFADLAKRGVTVMLSNSDTALTKKLYSDFNMHKVYSSRSINCKPDGRNPVSELIICS